MGRSFIVGDIHGAFKALTQVLKRAGFNQKEDTLYCTGDIVDGFPESMECIDFLMNLPNCKSVIGNHDIWFQNYLENPQHTPLVWLDQGGFSTINSFNNWILKEKNINKTPHILEWFEALPYVIETKNFIVVHGGLHKLPSQINTTSLNRNDKDSNKLNFVWDRSLYFSIIPSINKDNLVYSENNPPIIFGHTPVQVRFPHITTPIFSKGDCYIALDTGCGHGMKLSLIESETWDFWQSDPTSELYRDFVMSI